MRLLRRWFRKLLFKSVSWSEERHLARRLPLNFMVLIPPGRRDWLKSDLSRVGSVATPVEVKRWIEREERRTQIHGRLERLRSLGTEVEFVNCDVSNPSELKTLIDELKSQGQAVDLLIHGAGVEISKPTISKSAHDWDLTLDAKVHAAQTLLETLKPRRAMLMGSVAGRFGNAMQTDYAAANAMLAALAEEHHHTLCVDWTAWAGAGWLREAQPLPSWKRLASSFSHSRWEPRLVRISRLVTKWVRYSWPANLGGSKISTVLRGPIVAATSLKPWTLEVDPRRSPD